MLYLCLAILSSAMVSVIMRLSSRRVTGNIAMLAMNYLMCLLLSSLYTHPGGLFPASPRLPQTLLLGGIHGVLYLVSFVLLQTNVRRNGVVLPATFMKLGLLVPMVLSVFLFKEMPGGAQILGFVLAISAILLINAEKDTSVVRSAGGLVLLLLTGGAADAMSKIYEEVGEPALSDQFLFYTFVTALVLCLALMLWKKQKIGKNEAFFGLIIGIPNFFSAKFLLGALNSLPAVVVYPTYSVATILVVTLIGALCFRERLSKRQWVALGIILAALTLLNL